MKIVAIFALKEESFEFNLPNAEVQQVFAGIGKTMAATATANAINRFQPDLVINIGTVGTYRHQMGDILVATHFIDRDMKRTPLDGLVSEICTDDLNGGMSLPSIVDGKENNNVYTINTGDNFVLSAEEDLGCDAVDMESFAMAWACKQAGVPFISVKCVTDILGQNSIKAWNDKVSEARQQLKEYFAKHGASLF